MSYGCAAVSGHRARSNVAILNVQVYSLAGSPGNAATQPNSAVLAPGGWQQSCRPDTARSLRVVWVKSAMSMPELVGRGCDLAASAPETGRGSQFHE